MHKPDRRGRNNSADSAVTFFADAGAEILPPAGVELETDAERTIWRQFAKARARRDWRDLDLILLAKAVKLEAEIRDYRAELKKSGPLVMNQRGTLVENPILRVIDTAQRQQLAVIRSISLTQLPADARTLNDSARGEEDARRTLEEQGAESLLAQPPKPAH